MAAGQWAAKQTHASLVSSAVTFQVEDINVVSVQVDTLEMELDKVAAD